MPYGSNQQLIGANIDPSLLLADYSGYSNAATASANSITSLGDSLAKPINDYSKEQKESKNILKSSQAQIDAAIKLFPDQAEYLSQISNELKNEDAPLSERAAVASGISEMIMMGVGQKRYETELGFKERELRMQERESNIRQHVAGLGITEAEDKNRSQRAKEQARNMITPELMDATINMIKRTPETKGMFTDEFLTVAKSSDPETQAALLEAMTKLLPEKQKMELIKDLPVTINGQPGTTAGMVDSEGNFSPLVIDLPEGVGTPADGMVLPPNGGDATTDPNGDMDNGPIPGLPVPGMSLGRVNTSPQEAQRRELEIQKLQGDISGQKAQSDQAAASVANNKAKATAALESLKEIRNHPGRKAATGASSYFPSIRGGDAYEFEMKLEQAKALAGTIGIEAMRGLGAMSEKEFQAAKDAIAQLALGQKTETIEKELDKLISLFEVKIGAAATPSAADPYGKANSRLQGFIAPSN